MQRIEPIGSEVNLDKLPTPRPSHVAVGTEKNI